MLVIIHLTLWFLMEFFWNLIGQRIYTFGVGYNLLVALGEYWRLLTPVFLHRDLMHCLFNSFALVIFGPALEQMIGRTRFLLAYIGAGIAGNIGTFLIEPLDYLHLGASGAIYGLFGMYIFMVAFRKHLIDSSSSQMIMTILIIGVLMSLVGRNINIIAHLAGFAGGFLIAPLVLKNIRPFSPWRAYQRSYPDNSGEIQFDPNRWSKKRRIQEKIRKNWLWIVIGALALLGIFTDF